MGNRSALIRLSSWNNSLIASLLVVMAGLAACWRALPAAIPEPATDTSTPVEPIDLGIAPVNPSTLDLGAGYPDLFNAGLTIQLVVPDADYQKGGSVVTILGSGFTLNSKVRFGDNGPVDPLSVSADGSSMTVRVPANSMVDGSGLVQYRNPGLVSLNVSDSGRTASNAKAQFLYYIETISFTEPQLIKTNKTRYFQIYDINRDGYPDIIMSNWVAINSNMGVFTLIQTNCGDIPFAIYDIDGDGFADCITRDSGAGYKKIIINYGDGTGRFIRDLTSFIEVKPNSLGYPTGIYVLHPKKISQADVIALDSEGGYHKITAIGRVLKSQDLSLLPVNLAANSYHPWISDINNDGGDDLIFRRYLSDGHGAVNGLLIGDSSPPWFMVFDPLSFGRTDFYLANGFFRRDINSMYIGIKYNPEDTNKIRKISTYNAMVIGSINEDFSYYFNPWVSVSDINADLQRDIMYIAKKPYDASYGFTFLLNIGTDKFVPSGKYFGIPSNSYEVWNPVVIDINNDNRPDLIFSIYSSTASLMYVRLGNGN